MDNTTITYLVKASVALALFYGAYMLFLKKDTFLRLRRFYFIFAILFSFSFPLVTIEIAATEESPVQIPGYWLSEMEVVQASGEASAGTALDAWSVVAIVLIIISVIYALRFIMQLLSVVRLRIDNESEKLQAYRIVKMKGRRASPFSFFNWIFITPEVQDSNELAEIIAHERVHARQYHSLDVVLAEVMCICFWWNPFAWLLKKEVKLNLEYLADEGVLQSGFNSKEYQYILLQVSNRSTGIPLINNFNVSQLKKRIMMMNKKRSSIFSSVKYLLILPVAVMLLMGNAVQATTSLDAIMEKTDIDQAPQKKGDVRVTAEQMPFFIGGLSTQQKFIADNLKYPAEAKKAGIQGRVTVRYIVKSTGEISDVEIVKGVHPLLDAEAVRVIKSMPKWEPGKQGGKAVDVYYTLPIIFRLAGNNSSKVKSGGKPDEIAAVGDGAAPEKKVEVASLEEGSPNDKMMPFMRVEQMPSFTGGETAMHEFIRNNLKYPEAAQKNGLQGRVTVRFIVRSTGEISDASVIRGIDPDMDKEAVRTISSMPKWTPGTQNGQAVDVYYTIPIVYRLRKDNKK